jgi:glycosyltransferase involved in cell wall biosynthesis
MRISILGTRGIPNLYGGFEQFAEYLAVELTRRGHEVAVYLPHDHPFEKDEFQGVTLIRVFCPERHLGAAAQFIYDHLCLRDAVQRGFDIALECGYASVALSYYACPLRRTRIVTNMDGLEWHRAKWSPMVRKGIMRLESMAVRRSHYLVADNIGIQSYLAEKYGAHSEYIPYGTDIVQTFDPDLLSAYGVESQEYFLLIARLEPENNLEMVLDGYRATGLSRPFLVVGNHETPYGRHLKARYRDAPGVRFLGGIYRKPVLDTLRRFARLYLHGHSVGGTNPSLLEAMGCLSLIAAHDNPFNRAVIQDGGFYFKSAGEVESLLTQELGSQREAFTTANLHRIHSEFTWSSVVDKYEALFKSVIDTSGDALPVHEDRP